MDLIVNNPFAPILAACLVAALVLAVISRLTQLRWVATLAAPVVFLVAYVATYQKVPPFPPVGASNKVFYVALVVMLGAGVLDAIGKLPRPALAGAASLLAAGWIGSSKLADPDSTTLFLFAALSGGGGVALWGLDHVATLPHRSEARRRLWPASARTRRPEIRHRTQPGSLTERYPRTRRRAGPLCR